MSSETSTDAVRDGTAVRLKADTTSEQSLQPWQFFVLAGLGCATVATFLARAQGITSVILLTAMMGATVFVGLAVLRAVRPLMTSFDDRTIMIGERTRAALEREKMLALRAIKELEFDRAMGKLSESDFKDMSSRLRTRAARLMRQLDAGTGYRAQIERDVAKRLSSVAEAPVARFCGECGAARDADAKFCKNCGAKL